MLIRLVFRKFVFCCGIPCCAKKLSAQFITSGTTSADKMTSTTNSEDETFQYFSYGSNLLSARIHLQNPTAVFNTIGRLDNYRLDFDYLSQAWRGAAATIVESQDDHVWGVVWDIKASDMEYLDNQEGVRDGIYEPITVDVTSADGKKLTCRTYRMLAHGSRDRRPSPHYLEVIVSGASQHGLPNDYIERLKSIQTNGYKGPLPLFDKIMTQSQAQNEKGTGTGSDPVL